ncbi:hypothetical protein P4O66_018443, partial [Electrophorus voltai]
GQYVEFFKEIGGVTFIYNLFSSSHYSEVKETALFALGSLAEFNEICKQTLCREEIFHDLMDCLKHEVSHNRKRVAVYMLSVLVSNNRQGQSFAQATGCIDILLNLFSDNFPDSGGPREVLQLWASVSSALCGCVNNPQNEENQRACMCVFPLVRVWLVQVSVSRQELAQPICSFIGMAVANNMCAQEYFASLGGLVTLSDSLASLVPHCKDDIVACKLATTITRTLSACIADNEALAPVLSKLRLVPHLLLLLSVPNLSPQDQLVVVMTLGHCTSACVAHQSQLLLGGGLSLMISLLTETNDEEVRKAVTFVLQTCKKITDSLGRDVSHQDKDCVLQRHWESAREILQRIQRLEKRQLIGEELEKDAENSSDWHPQPVLLRSVECREELWEGSVVRKQQFQRQILRDFDKSLNPEKKKGEQQQNKNGRVGSENNTDFPMLRDEEIKKREREKMERDERGEGIVKMKAHFNRSMGTNDWINGNPNRAKLRKPPMEGDRDLHSPHIFKHPAPMKRSQQQQTLSEDELSLCSELLDSEIERILAIPAASKDRQLRCAGCVIGVDEVDSRSVGAVLRLCRCLCQFHRMLQKAEGHLKRSLRCSGVVPMCSDASMGHNAASISQCFQTCSKYSNCMKKKGTEGNREGLNQLDTVRFINLTPLKRPCETKVL